jgi:hypothetical protein
VSYGIPFVLGPLLFFTYLHFVTGDFWGYVHHQGEHYCRVFGSPIEVVLNSFRHCSVTFPENLITILILIYLALYSNRKIGIPLWCYAAAILLFSPVTGSFQCVYRHYLLVFPLHYLCGVSTKPIYIKISVMAICGYLCVKHFFLLYLTGVLV